MVTSGRRCFRPAISCVFAVLVAACSVACMQITIASPPPLSRCITNAILQFKNSATLWRRRQACISFPTVLRVPPPTTRTSSTSRDCPTMRRKSSSTLGYLANTCSLLLLPVCSMLCRRCLRLPLQTCRPTLPSSSPVCRCRMVSLLAYRQQ